MHRTEIGEVAGTPVHEYVLRSGSGADIEATIMTYGAILKSVRNVDRQGQVDELTLGFDTLEGYLGDHPYFGATIGRYGNRIAGGRFSLDGRQYTLATNNGPNHLHGGLRGFDKALWRAEDASSASGGDSVRLNYTSPDGEEGYPGQLDVTVQYTLKGTELRIDYTARCDAPTHLNLTNHAYWNLAGHDSGDVLSHELTLNADRYLPVDDDLIPTGVLESVAGTAMDFTTPYTIGARIAEAGGYDHCFVLAKELGELGLAAHVVEPRSGRTMEVWTTEPGVQLYTGNFLDNIRGRSGARYGEHHAFCLEAQHFPDSPNQPEFPSTRLEPGQTYTQTTLHRLEC